MTPSSAGHCVGSSVWTITLHSDKFVYMSDGSLGSSGASQGQGGRESYSWHPPPLDMCGLKGAGNIYIYVKGRERKGGEVGEI